MAKKKIVEENGVEKMLKFKESIRSRMKNWVVVGFLVGLFAALSALQIPGCDGGLTEGMLIGAGGSAAAGEAVKLAEKRKVELAVEILDLRKKLEEVVTEEEKSKLEEDLSAAHKKLSDVELGELVATKIQEGFGRDFRTGDPEGQASNIQWAVQGFLAIWVTMLKRRQWAQDKGIARFEGENSPAVAKKLHDNIKEYRKKLIA